MMYVTPLTLMVTPLGMVSWSMGLIQHYPLHVFHPMVWRTAANVIRRLFRRPLLPLFLLLFYRPLLPLFLHLPPPCTLRNFDERIDYSLRPAFTDGDSSVAEINSVFLDSLSITVITLNVRGVSGNLPYLNQLLKSFLSPKIVFLCEHWLDSYDQHLLGEAFPDYSYTIQSVADTDGSFHPALARGQGCVAILWDKCIDKYVSVVSSPCHHRVVGVRVACHPQDMLLFSCYLPTRSGCTNKFKAVMDSCLTLAVGLQVVFLGDFNADLGSLGVLANEQGVILKRYLDSWGYVSVTLQFSLDTVFPYTSDEHGSTSCIDHVLCPRDCIGGLVEDCVVLTDHHLNMSDHLPVVATLSLILKFQHASDRDGRAHLSTVFRPNWKRCGLYS